MPILPNNSNFFRCFYNIYTNQKFLNKNMLTVYTVLYLHVFFFHFKCICMSHICCSFEQLYI